MAGLSRRGLLWLVGLLVAGSVARVLVAFATYGIAYDIDSLRIVARALQAPGEGVYASGRWPYPAGFLPLVAASRWVSAHTGLAFDGVVQLPAILADAGIASLVGWALLSRGAGERRALAGVALVALGPSFALISGYHGQIDSVAILPALAGVLLWERMGRRRGVLCGALVGLGAAVKQPPGFAVLALWPTARSWRERLVVAAAALAVPLLSVLPFVVVDPGTTLRALTSNKGVPGFGGISAFVAPELTRYWSVFRGAPPVSSATLFVVEVQNAVVVLGVVAAGAFAMWRRVPPLPAATLIWLVVYVVKPNFGYEYLIWGLPFFIAAGHLRAVAVFQAAILPASLLLYWRPGVDSTGWIYFVAVQVVWLGLVAAAARHTWTLWRGETFSLSGSADAAVGRSVQS